MKPVHIRKMLNMAASNLSDNRNKTGKTATVKDPESTTKKETMVTHLPTPALSTSFMSPLSSFSINAVFKKMPEIQSDLEQHRRLQVEARRSFVRIVVDDMRSSSERCSKKQFQLAAEKIVCMYPDAFEDRIGEVRIETGYDSLMKQFIARNENLNRTPGGKPKDKPTFIPLPKRKPDDTDTYGCINWGPNVSQEQSAYQETVRKSLKDMYGAVEDWSTVEDGMEKSYGLLRSHLNENTPLEKLLVDWPFLLETNVIVKHCELLLGLDIPKAIEQAYSQKAPVMLRYFRSKQQELGMGTFLSQLDEEKSKENLQAILQGFLICLQKCLGDKEDSLLFQTDDMASNEEVEAANTKTWPRLAMLGGSCLSAKQFALLVDGKVVARYQSFMTAISMLFAMYYMLNIEYPKEAAASLEFIQRSFDGINPHKGTKIEKAKKKASSVDPRVLKFTNKLSDFQWRE